MNDKESHLVKSTGQESDNGKLFVFRVSGAVNLTVQKELSAFVDTERIIETKPWFD